MNFRIQFALAFLLLICSLSWAQDGCTDSRANNYDPNAMNNDGSCTYNASNSTPTQIASLPATVNESSGLTYAGGKLWTHNDSGGANEFYEIDPATSAVLKTVTITNATHVDWEDITSDGTYLYIGDFGNNDGDRTDLVVYKVDMSTIGPGATASVTAQAINFSYADQLSFISSPQNTPYDCEAFFYAGGSLHLFTKDWVNMNTSHYILPITPGTYSISIAETFNINYLVTGADINPQGDLVLLSSYDISIAPGVVAMWQLYDFTGTNYFSGNKRPITLGTGFTPGQVEAICFRDNTTGYLSSETIVAGMLTITGNLYGITVLPYGPLNSGKIDWSIKSSLSGDLQVDWSLESNEEFIALYLEAGPNLESFPCIKALPLRSQGNFISDHNTWSLGICKYFRIKAISLDGEVLLSEIKELRLENTKHLEAEIYPNPANHEVNILTQEDRIYSLVNHKGQLVWQGELASDMPKKISLTGYPSGIYYLMTWGQEKHQAQKLQIFH